MPSRKTIARKNSPRSSGTTKETTREDQKETQERLDKIWDRGLTIAGILVVMVAVIASVYVASGYVANQWGDWAIDFGPETYIALASATVAICALGVTVWQGRQNHKHNKLSVRPFLEPELERQRDDSNDQGKIILELVNRGVGPAIIKNFVLLFNGEEVSQNSIKTYHDFLNRKLKDFHNASLSACGPEESIQIGQRLGLISFNYIISKQNVSFFDKLDFLIEYQSIYQDETYTYDSRKYRQLHDEE